MTQIKVLPSPEALAHAVAGALVARLAAVQAAHRLPSVLLTGGTIADKVHRAIAALPPDGVDWTQVDFWWGDERYVPAGSEDRNARAAEHDLLEVIGVDPTRVHAMPAAAAGHPDVESAAAAYGEELRTYGGGMFDLVLLGMGPDGHVASLFPGFPQLHIDDEIAVAVTGSPKPPPERITLTFPALNRTREVWFLVTGEGKAKAVASAFAEEGTVDRTPARGITVANTTWWLDEDAAGSL